jgi:hypothetical protein
MDLCGDMQLPSNPLYSFFKQFKKKSCPFPEGHVEIFDHGEICQVPDNLPASYEGRFRIKLQFSYPEALGTNVDCTIVNFDLVDMS